MLYHSLSTSRDIRILVERRRTMEVRKRKLEPNEITKVILSICLHKSFELCGETLNREIGRKSWCHNGAQKEIGKLGGSGKENGIWKLYIPLLLRLPPETSFCTPVAPEKRAAAFAGATVVASMKKANFRTFVARFAALWVNLDDVFARAADGQSSSLLMRAQAL